MCIKPFLNPHFCNFYLGNSGLHADYNCRNILCAVVQTFVFTSNLRNFKIKLSCQKCKRLFTWGQKHSLSCPITSIIKPRSCKERQVQIKFGPGLRFLLLWLSFLKGRKSSHSCFLNTITLRLQLSRQTESQTSHPGRTEMFLKWR